MRYCTESQLGFEQQREFNSWCGVEILALSGATQACLVSGLRGSLPGGKAAGT